jgi:hypothetical protein
MLPYLMTVHQDSAWATHGVSAGIHVEDMHLGEVGPDRLLGHVVNYCHSWCPPSLRVSCCQVYTLARLTIDFNLHDTLIHW